MLYIIRHGLTDWNVRHKLQGQTETGLNDEGIAMAVEARDKYKDIHFDVCYSSPILRAKQTAEILLEGRDIEIKYDDRLKEIKFGTFEGVENAYHLKGSPIVNFFKDPKNYVAPEGAESIKELAARTGEFLKEVALPLVEDGKDVLIVGHGAMNSSIVMQIRNNPVSKFWDEPIENCVLKQLI